MDHAETLQRRVEQFVEAVQKMARRCSRCGGGGLVRSAERWKAGPGGDMWKCPDCKGSGYKVNRQLYLKVFWNMRSHAYRVTPGQRAEVATEDYARLQRIATPVTAGSLHSVELLDDTHGVSWHIHRGEYSRFDWVREEEYGWAWYSAPHDGPWPQSNADFGYPGARPSDFIESEYDRFEDRTIVRTKSLDVAPGLSLVFGVAYQGRTKPKEFEQALALVYSTSKSWRFLKKVHHSLSLDIDGSITQFEDLKRDGTINRGSVTETLAGPIPFATLRKLGSATSIEGRVGLDDDAQFSLTRLHRLVLHELVTQLE
ncbi:MAG: hypothetical protein H6674_10100 [Dehalococcoidia bacterium]|nr:hypothetical protein [Dehalococcoidia bacterium]